jgi:2-polyprenyl-6-methoxyphenol hydroxylase-like FAD-dependent oxidoreductase
MLSRSGFVTAMLVEAVPGGDLERIASSPVQEELGSFSRELRATLGKHFPMTAERITDAFQITGERDVLQGAVTPAVRTDYTRLESGIFAMSLGDAHASIDPLSGQGANVASYSAWVMGDAITSDFVYDERFCRRVANRRAPVVQSISELTNLMLNPLPHYMQFTKAMAQSKALCDAYGNLFNDPERQYDVLATAERTTAFIAHGGRADADRR